MNDHDDELNEIMQTPAQLNHHPRTAEPCCGSEKPCIDEEEPINQRYEQWSTNDDKLYFPAARTIKELPPGCYEVMSCPAGVYLQRIPVRTEGLLRFPQTNSEKVIKEIQKFWDREKYFRRFGLTYKRGIVLWGPPGSGKSCTIQIIMADVVGRGGVVVKFSHPRLFIEGMRIIRQIQSKTPIVVLMEDMDSIIENYSPSEVLNILDGVDQIENTVFLATTNYPQKLGPRIINRPSRFDKRFKIDHPNAESRKMYLNHIMRDADDLEIDVDKWVKDTEKFSLAHLKELFVAVVILGDEYDKALKGLRSMKEIISSEDDKDRQVGFGSGNKGED